MRLIKVTSWEMESVKAVCTTATGKIAVRTGKDIQVLDRSGTTRNTYDKLCDQHPNYYKWMSEMSTGKYLADLCEGCGEIRVVDMATRLVYTAYSSSPWSLSAMCSGPVEGPLLVWDDNTKAVIQLQWNEATKKLDEVRQVQVPGERVYHMCYMPNTDLVILTRCGTYPHYIHVVKAVKLHGGAGQLPVWQLKRKVLGKKINPWGVSCDSEGHLYVADGNNSRVLLSYGSTGEVVQELLQDVGLGCVEVVCCMSNPRQLMVKHYDYRIGRRFLTLYNVTSQ